LSTEAEFSSPPSPATGITFTGRPTPELSSARLRPRWTHRRKREGFEQAHGPGGTVVMEKLRDGKIELGQLRLFTDLVGKVHE
jgi:hypothetical protein